MTQMRDESRKVACTPYHLAVLEVAHTVVADIVGWDRNHSFGLWKPVSCAGTVDNGNLQGPVDKREGVVPWAETEEIEESDTVRSRNFRRRGVSDTHCWHSAEPPVLAAPAAADTEPGHSTLFPAWTDDDGVPCCRSQGHRCSHG